MRLVRGREAEEPEEGRHMSGEDEKGQGEPHGLAFAKDGPDRDIIHESLARGRAWALPRECRQIKEVSGSR